jgi:hypothetical protein
VQDIYPVHFFLLICWNYVRIIVDLTEILNSWLEIENLRNGQFGSLNYFVVLQLAFAKTKLLVMASKLQLI